MDRAERAAEIFSAGDSCSQAVFAVLAPSLGIEHQEALRLAAGFGGGMRIGGTCGAATGALLALGPLLCDEECSHDSRKELMVAVATFFERFAAEVGSTECPEILGCDFRTPEGKAYMDEHHLRQKTCLPAVRAAVRIVESMAGL
jgi:C_GCAxxG_C_C family probable redox protein